MPEDPDAESVKKLYYSISEVSEMLGVKPHVLRYWETQFGALRPKKSRAGNRMYRERDVEILRQIQELLHVRRYTIAGARRELSRLRTSGATVTAAAHEESEDGADGALEVAAHEDTGAQGGDFEAVSGSAKDDSTHEVSAHEIASREASTPVASSGRDRQSARSGAGDTTDQVGSARTARPTQTAESVAEPTPVLAGASAHSTESRSSREADSDPIQTSLNVPRPTVPRAALTELREEIVRLQEWLEQRAKH